MPLNDNSLNTSGMLPIVGMWNWDVQSDHIQADKRLCEYFSVRPCDGQSGMPIASFVKGIHPDDRTHVSERISEAVATGRPFHETYRVQSQAFGTRLIRAEGVCFRDGVGLPGAYPGLAVDITNAMESEPRVEVINKLMEAHEFARRTKESLLTRLIEAVLLEAGRAYAEHIRRR